MNQPLPLLGGITPHQFLQQYWQKKPLLIRNALPNLPPLISPEELAGLACEEEVESRIVIEKGGDRPWQLLNGPFDEQHFLDLPESHWTLLVQEANKHLPELTSLVDQFNFIPRWRFDDVMISYAPDQGTVGPHYDYYDVFLIQVSGKKRWQINTAPVAPDNTLADIPLRIMADFSAESEWMLEPGDMLYLPPGVAHHGVALGESITYSVGYRALSENELLTSLLDDVVAHNPPHRYLQTAQQALQNNPGEIAPATLQQLRSVLARIPQDDAGLAQWFGRYITEPRVMPPDLGDPDYNEALLLAQCQNFPLQRCSSFSRFNFTHLDGVTTLFVDGESYPLPADIAGLVPLLCNQSQLTTLQLHPYLKHASGRQLLTQLAQAGVIYFDEQD